LSSSVSRRLSVTRMIANKIIVFCDLQFTAKTSYKFVTTIITLSLAGPTTAQHKLYFLSWTLIEMKRNETKAKLYITITP
jgi:hypothetical protein